MSGGRTFRSAAVAGLLAILVCGGCSGGTEGAPIGGPVLAAVSYSPEEVVLIEPGTLSVIRRIGLRSMGTDPLAIEGSRTFVTAQCGGLGDDADDAIALIDLADGGRVRYVELPEPNPGFVASTGDGAVLVSHGVWDPGGIPVTRVDLSTGRVVDRGRVANAYDGLVVAGGSLWTVGPEGVDVVDPAYTVRRTALDLSASTVFPADGQGTIVAPDGDSAETLLMGVSDGRSARMSRVSATDLSVITSNTIDGLENGVCEIIDAGGLLVLRDSSGQDASDPGGPLVVLDRETLREVRRIDVGGSVSSIAALGDTVFAITWDSGEIIAIDPASGAILRRARIEGLAGRMTQLAAMDATEAPGGP